MDPMYFQISTSILCATIMLQVFLHWGNRRKIKKLKGENKQLQVDFDKAKSDGWEMRNQRDRLQNEKKEGEKKEEQLKRDQELEKRDRELHKVWKIEFKYMQSTVSSAMVSLYAEPRVEIRSFVQNKIELSKLIELELSYGRSLNKNEREEQIKTTKQQLMTKLYDHYEMMKLVHYSQT